MVEADYWKSYDDKTCIFKKGDGLGIDSNEYNAQCNARTINEKGYFRVHIKPARLNAQERQAPSNDLKKFHTELSEGNAVHTSNKYFHP